jgi:hypothetical protein
MTDTTNAPAGFGRAWVIDARPEAEDAVIAGDPRFSIATLVTDRAQYAAMQASFIAGGFDDTCTEFLAIDNTGESQTAAHTGLNRALLAARGAYVVLCHQDVRLIDDGRATLEARLAALTARDPHWALAGNAGGISAGRLALRISDPHGEDQHRGELPARAISLDENFIVVRRSARVGFSRDLDHFHLYGADLALQAEIAGRTAYVIDFHLRHLSPGRKDASFHAAEQAFRTRWSRALRPRLMQTTCSLMRVSGGAQLGPLADRALAAALRRIKRIMPEVRAPHAGWRETVRAMNVGGR